MPDDPKPRLTRCALLVKDIKRMEAFYRKVLGFAVTDRGSFRDMEELVFLSNDPGEHHQFVLVTGRPDKVGMNLVGQLSFFVEDLDELRAIHGRVLEEDNNLLNRCSTHGNAWSIYFNDPEENVIEVYTHTSWYIPQPHAVPFDLTQSNEEIMRVTEEHCRQDPGFKSAQERRAQMSDLMS